MGQPDGSTYYQMLTDGFQAALPGSRPPRLGAAGKPFKLIQAACTRHIRSVAKKNGLAEELLVRRYGEFVAAFILRVAAVAANVRESHLVLRA